MHDNNLVAIVAVGGGFVVAVLCTGFYFGYLAWRSWQETTLKRDMVERGYSAQEIIDVVIASNVGREGVEEPVVPPQPAVKEPGYR
jgi:hypothetical protein